MRLRACSLAVLAAVPAFAANSKRSQQNGEALHLVDSIVQGNNLEGDLARVKYLAEADLVSTEAARAVPITTEPRQRQNLSFALGVLASRSGEAAMLQLTKDSDPVVRMNAAQGLGRLPTKEWKALLPLLKDPSMGVRTEAARAAGATHASKLGKPLLAAAKIEGEPEVRAVILAAAGDCQDKTVIPGLVAFLESSSESTRLGAARGLVHLGAPAGLAFAKKLLDSKEKFQRRSGLELFEGASARVSGPVLHGLLKDPDTGLAAKAARMLYQSGEAVMLEWLVLASFHAKLDDKDAYERELELLHLQDDQRKAILKKAGAI